MIVMSFALWDHIPLEETKQTSFQFNQILYISSLLTMTNALEAARGNLTTFFCMPKAL